ncbi:MULTISPECIES: NAD(P)H-dependent oxidoreductase [Loigolactobacillus]|uniref:NAD(P)H-dependent oxidoreductase n=1 Tax=Loigolactobacillus TaxID=2767889 RepID=UPI000F7E9375|nr:MULTISPECIES: NAD(P)H-dependent oxidoreductase [Loigolactobacillus]MDA5387899.1 FAD-binding protein [Loigolactobacillus backii]MDA5390391.1 FAD-binding protein [Loigolactobacillus backii]
MKFIGIVGTNADFSYNRQLLQYMQTHFGPKQEIEICEINHLPLFNENIVKQPPVSITQLAAKISSADGVIIATPEYDHSIPAALKSVLEWLSCELHPFNHKPIMIVGASYGPQGASRAQQHLRQILDSPGLGAFVQPGNEFLLNYVKAAFDEQHQLKDQQTISFLESCFNNYLDFTTLINQKYQKKVTQLPQESQITWNGAYDVIVVGFGAAGATAARFAADNGAKVLLTDVAPEGHEGGNVRYAGQVVATGTDYTKMLSYYKAMLGPIDLDDTLLQTYVQGMINMRSYFKNYLDVEPVSYNDTYKNGSHGEVAKGLAPEYPEFPGSDTFDLSMVHEGFFDAALWKNLRQHVVDRTNNIDVWLSSPAQHLVQDPLTKTITGVTIKRNGQNVNIQAKNGVVLACGGFETDKQAIQDYLGAPHLAPIGTLYNQGDGIKMAEEIGADMWHMKSYEGLGLLSGMTFATHPGERGKLILAPWKDLYTGSIFVVGDDGSRYFREDEANRHGRLYSHGTWRIPTAQDHPYLIFDQVQFDQFKAAKQLPEQDFFERVIQAANLPELAQKTNLNAATLQQTVADFNTFAKTGHDYSQHRAAKTMRALTTGPYYAVKLESGMLNTQGGPRRNANAEILNTQLQPIPHLYGAGELGGANANQYAGGSNLAECLIFGKIAGENAAKEKTTSVSTPTTLNAKVDLGSNDLAPEDSLKDISVGENQYLGVSDTGIGGQVVVRVTYTNQQIKNVEVVKQSESEDVGKAAVEQLPAKIVAANSYTVDAISGASASSNAIKSAVKNALTKAKTTN